MYRASLLLARLGRFSLVPFVAVMLTVGMTACQPGSDAGGDAAADSASAPPVVDVTAADYAFAAPDTIPAGWVTFRMTNKGEESHHFHLDRLVEGVTVADWREAIKEPVDSVAKLVRAGKIDSAEATKAIMKAFDRATPDSTFDFHAQTHGGVGFVAPGRTGQTTHRVEPGHYVMICVLRAPSGLSHASLGMAHGLVVVESSAERSPPTPDVTVQAAGREIRMDGLLSSGTQTMGFSVEEVPEGLREGTDGYYAPMLVRLDDTTSAAEVAAWRFQNPPPFEAIGGVEYYPPSQPAYMTADLEPGRYAWAWYYQGFDYQAGDEPIVKEFTVE